MKRRIFSLLLAAVLGLSLCACNGLGSGDKQGENGSEADREYNPLLYAVPEGGYDGSEVTIKFSHTLSSWAWGMLDAYIAEFNRMYPNIHVVHELVGD